MKRTTERRNEMALTLRTERGTSSIIVGLNDLNLPEQKLLLDIMNGAHTGTTVDFSLMPCESGHNLMFAIRKLPIQLEDDSLTSVQ